MHDAGGLEKHNNYKNIANGIYYKIVIFYKYEREDPLFKGGMRASIRSGLTLLPDS
jgi:hypothetical protein